MKKVMMLILALLCVSVYANACEVSDPTCTCDVVDTDTQRQPWGYGVGADAIVYRSNNPLVQQVAVETRYDIENRETRVFGVVQVDIFSLLGGNNG